MKKIKQITLTSIFLTLCFLANAQEPQTGLDIGNIAPEIKLKSPEGKEIPLSSLRGKIVLIDFWASWCGPCRRENSNVVSAFEKFKHKQFKNGNGFTIYGVSLDKNLNAWKAAIKQDNLSWKHQVSDLGGWKSSAAKLYHIHGIPANYLIDANGMIIAKNLRGTNLHAVLMQLLK